MKKENYYLIFGVIVGCLIYNFINSIKYQEGMSYAFGLGSLSAILFTTLIFIIFEATTKLDNYWKITFSAGLSVIANNVLSVIWNQDVSLWILPVSIIDCVIIATMVGGLYVMASKFFNFSHNRQRIKDGNKKNF